MYVQNILYKIMRGYIYFHNYHKFTTSYNLYGAHKLSRSFFNVKGLSGEI